MNPPDVQEARPNDSDGSGPDEPDYYVENGRVVFTAAYHLRRGRCCGSGCRHCPFDGVEKRDRPADQSQARAS